VVVHPSTSPLRGYAQDERWRTDRDYKDGVVSVRPERSVSEVEGQSIALR
jgi:hypothetical protein